VELAKELIADVRRFDEQLAANAATMTALLDEHGTRLPRGSFSVTFSGRQVFDATTPSAEHGSPFRGCRRHDHWGQRT
jgi:hypothetical protein